MGTNTARRGIWLIAVLLLALGLGCSRGQPATADTPEAVTNLVRELSQQWIRAINAKDVDKTLSFYAADATAYPPGAAVAVSEDLRRKVWTDILAQPGFRLDVTASGVEPARSGDRACDLAVENGAFILTLSDKQGNPIGTRGKYVVVWKKQIDGTWKAYHDIWNLDQ